MKPLRYYQFIEKDTSEISIVWKVLHATIFCLLSVNSAICVYGFIEIFDIFNYNCVLYGKPYFTYENYMRTDVKPSTIQPPTGNSSVSLNVSTNATHPPQPTPKVKQLILGLEDQSTTTVSSNNSGVNGLTPKIIKERLDDVYGRSSPSYSVVKEWAKRFRIGQELLEDDERPGRPVEVITEDKVALVEDLVLSDRRLKLDPFERVDEVPVATAANASQRPSLNDSTPIPNTEMLMCDYVIFIPMLGMVVSSVFAGVVMVCGRGGRGYSSDTIPGSWIVVYPIIIGSGVMFVLSFNANTVQQKAGKREFYRSYQMCFITYKIQVALWLAQLLLGLLRILLFTDFDFYSVLVKRRDDDSTAAAAEEVIIYTLQCRFDIILNYLQ
nr:unnamed protein product [Callosobruchus analis]